MRALIEKELAFSCGVIRDGHEITPRFAITTPEGDYTILCPLPDAHEVRIARLELVSRFMAYRMATRFVFSTEIITPDAVTVIGVTRRSCLGGVRLIERKPFSFSATEWLEGVDQIGDEIPALFPREVEELSATHIAELESASRLSHRVG